MDNSNRVYFKSCFNPIKSVHVKERVDDVQSSSPVYFQGKDNIYIYIYVYIYIYIPMSKYIPYYYKEN